MNKKIIILDTFLKQVFAHYEAALAGGKLFTVFHIVRCRRLRIYLLSRDSLEIFFLKTVPNLS